MLAEFRRGKRELDGNLLTRAGFGRIAARHGKLAIAGQQYRGHLADLGIFRDAFDRFGCRIRCRRKHRPEVTGSRQHLRILLDRLQCFGLAAPDADTAGLAGVRVDDDRQQFRAVLLYRFRVVEERLRNCDRQRAQFANDGSDALIDGLLAVFVERHLVR